jgi:uncharacterized protein (DUF1015 family)
MFPMANVLPFLALRYDLERVSAAQVVTQPYDKITSAMQDRYYAASPYNLVRIILGRSEQGDNTAQNVYTRAASYSEQWRNESILQPDSLPSMYAYSQGFRSPVGGNRLERHGFIALGRVEDYSANVVFRHEQTLAKPKADRLELLRATRVHYEQLFLLYEDSGEVEGLLAPGRNSRPAIEVEDEYEVVHRVWQISDSEAIAGVCQRMREKKLVIADGHHRYETALNYRNERRAAAGKLDPQAPYEFVMMTFVNMNDPGLVILPTHRVVHSLKSFSADDFQSSAHKVFGVEEIDRAVDPDRAMVILRERSCRGTALLAVTANRAFLLHSPKLGATSLLAKLSPRQQALEVVQLHKCLLEGVLGLSEESIRNQKNLAYVREAGEALAQVRSGAANIAFLVNSCRVEQVRDIAFAGEVMPQKSTDFYPKLLSGLTAYALD